MKPIEKYNFGDIATVNTFRENKKFSAKIINENEDSILFENSAGMRASCLKADILSLRVIRRGGV